MARSTGPGRRLAPGLALVGATLAALPAQAECRVTRGAYDGLRQGMSLQAVEARLGCKGEPGIRLKVGRQVRRTFTWPARGTYGANVNLTFTNGRLTDKSQLGLR